MYYRFRNVPRMKLALFLHQLSVRTHMASRWHPSRNEDPQMMNCYTYQWVSLGYSWLLHCHLLWMSCYSVVIFWLSVNENLVICEWECEEGDRGKWDKTENLLVFCEIRKLFIPSKVLEQINNVGSSSYYSPSQNYTSTNRVLFMQVFKINLSFITEEW